MLPVRSSRSTRGPKDLLELRPGLGIVLPDESFELREQLFGREGRVDLSHDKRHEWIYNDIVDGSR